MRNIALGEAETTFSALTHRPIAFTIAGGKIVEIDLLADPARLRTVELTDVSG